jgi:septal ring factor EnvC (AmiA/AmiB activator)
MDVFDLRQRRVDDLEPKKQAIHAEWESARDREKARCSRFAQHTLSPEAVAADFQQALASVAAERAAAQLATHERVREAARTRGRVTVQPVLPVDILGAYVLLPMPENGGAP